MSSIYRTHKLCDDLKKLVGKKARLAGWVDTIRDHGGITFVVIRDQFGSFQIVISDSKLLENVNKETVVSVEGIISARTAENANKKVEHGELEMKAESLDILGPCTEKILPFEIDESETVRDEIRLKYRFLDLRNKKVAQKILIRSQVIAEIRKQMTALGFIEFQTPILTSSSPEGARDFLVPSRLHEGKFYALPQAPQQFKQLLMTSGFDKYFQIAPCFRDEDGRADRTPGEFYQLDLEMSFATQDDVLEVGEKVMNEVFKKFAPAKSKNITYPRISYNEAMEKYGSDKPDLRNPLTVTDLTKIFEKAEFKAFTGSFVKGIIVKTGEQPRSFYDNLTEEIVNLGAKGLVWFKTGDKGELIGPVEKFLSETEKQEINTAFKGIKKGDSVFMLATKNLLEVQKLSGQLRKMLGEKLDIIDKREHKFCWIVDFPMFEVTDEGKVDFSHNPFSMPQGGMDSLVNKNPLNIFAYQYDLVCDGYELASGGVRNHNPEIMVKAFEIAGYSEETVLSKFPALYNAFKFGAPPHAGMAPGIERLVMILTGSETIKDVIAYPMTKNGLDLMMNSPSEVTEKQLRDVHIKLRREIPNK